MRGLKTYYYDPWQKMYTVHWLILGRHCYLIDNCGVISNRKNLRTRKKNNIQLYNDIEFFFNGIVWVIRNYMRYRETVLRTLTCFFCENCALIFENLISVKYNKRIVSAAYIFQFCVVHNTYMKINYGTFFCGKKVILPLLLTCNSASNILFILSILSILFIPI